MNSPRITIRGGKKHIASTIKKELKIEHDIKYIDKFMDGMNLIIERNGIVSLTETPRNILMWAHYANQHEGMCIGYKKSAFEKMSTSEIYPQFQISQTVPVKVNYDNCRFSDEFFEGKDHRAYKEILTAHYLTKSDEWIYEKEHRSIISYASATSLLIDPSKFNQLETEDSLDLDIYIGLGGKGVLPSHRNTPNKFRRAYHLPDNGLQCVAL
ncbi:DUF2971 domain-containing protein [Aeromonas hydrophila]|nr:DUF2971 domain-containing protein [Aeromonas hydrophila]